MKKLIFVTLLAITVVVVAVKINRNNIKNETPSEPRPPAAQPTLSDALASVNEKDCRDNLNFLASDEMEGRMSGKKGNVASAEFIKKKLEDYGLKTTTQKFKISRVNPGPNNETGDDFTSNVYAWIEGGELKDEIVVVGAHFDHIGYGPRYSRSGSMAVHNGADDNASGTVAVLEVAKAMSRLKPARTVVFQFYSAEEMGLLGSRFYCDNPLFPIGAPDIKKHVAMVNLDMVGHLDLDKFKVTVPEGIDMKGMVRDLGQKYGFASGITGHGTGGSDHASFYNKKIPVAFLHTGLNKYYHTPQDDVDTLNIKGVAEVSKYALELSWKLANESKPSFDEASFRKMDYTHDHGHSKF